MIFGLYLDGASWDFSLGCLQEALSGQRFYPLPELHVTPIQVKMSLFYHEDITPNEDRGTQK